MYINKLKKHIGWKVIPETRDEYDKALPVIESLGKIGPRETYIFTSNQHFPTEDPIDLQAKKTPPEAT